MLCWTKQFYLLCANYMTCSNPKVLGQSWENCGPSELLCTYVSKISCPCIRIPRCTVKTCSLYLLMNLFKFGQMNHLYIQRTIVSVLQSLFANDNKTSDCFSPNPYPLYRTLAPSQVAGRKVTFVVCANKIVFFYRNRE